MPILLKLHRCFCHGLKCFFYTIFRLICVVFFQDVNLGILAFNAINVYMYKGGTLCAQLLLQFYTIIFENLHVLISWPEDMNVP